MVLKIRRKGKVKDASSTESGRNVEEVTRLQTKEKTSRTAHFRGKGETPEPSINRGRTERLVTAGSRENKEFLADTVGRKKKEGGV